MKNGLATGYGIINQTQNINNSGGSIISEQGCNQVAW